ncbi:hypothetical protein ACSFA0_24680 [Variovorax sp. LT1P1]|uniref:hypothetical protein n=1 Tax=Variovorax sp. LT1P1 TaxID=3443730 RepID=UPI003F458D82
MMNSAIAKAAVLAILTGASFLSAAQPRQAFRSVDAQTLDVAGVKTGMDFEEAMAAAMKHFQVPRNQMKPETSPGEGLVTHARLPRYFTYEKRGVKLIVHFEDRVPVDKARPMAASLVIYELPWSQENAKAMAEAALTKYGPNSNAPYDLPMEWCAQPNKAQMGACRGGRYPSSIPAAFTGEAGVI